MKPTDFAYHLTGFLSKYLPGEAGASANTVASYRDAFTLFLRFTQAATGTPPERLTLAAITKEAVEGYLDWIESDRGCSESTRNLRLAALHSFFRYLQFECPDNIHEWQRILQIPSKRCKSGEISYLSVEGVRLLLAQPDTKSRRGRRDLALLALMYDSAARVQEAADLTPLMVRATPPYTIKLLGKGRKTRIIPLMEAQMGVLLPYMEERGLLAPHLNAHPLFFNASHMQLTRAGVAYILDKYARMARSENPSLIPERLSCHSLRHSKAMHLLQAGVNLVYIRDFLGHSSIQTTEIYARADSKQKREALEKAYAEVKPDAQPTWHGNEGLLDWLKRLG